MTLVGSDSAATSSLSLATGMSHLYMCLSKEHRVSRSFRATWFLSFLGQHLPQDMFLKNDDDYDQSKDFSVLSMSEPHLISPHTLMLFVCRRYSLVFVLDFSDNMRTVSNDTHAVKMDCALSALYAILTLLTRNFYAPGNSVLLQPKLCVTVLAYCGNSAKKVVRVLLQGIYMSKDNCSAILDQLKADITHLECRLADEVENQECESDSDSGEHKTPLSSGSLVGDHGLEGMVKAGTLAIQLLPRCALKGLVLLTDGVSGFTTPLSMHNTINSMRGANISCWVVHVGGGPHPTNALGLIPDMETLFFMTRACNGCVMNVDKIQESLSKVDNSDQTPNVVQQAVLFWTFQKGALAERVRGVSCDGWEEWEEPFAPIIGRGFNHNTISAPLLCLVGCKIREGFFLKDVQIKDSWIDICLYYPWQACVNIYYTITAPWPVSEGCVSLQTSTSYDGPYKFVHDIHCELNPVITFPHRMAAVRKFKQALQKFSSSDALLAHFLTFPNTPAHYILPQGVVDGMPLFYIPPNQTKPAPSVSLTSSGGKSYSPLVNFWRPLCTIDTSQWYRWFHSDKVVLVLRQNTTLPAHLLHPSSSGRYATIQCRLSASHLYNFLKSWSSLVLLENNSYIRFLPNSDTPRYFCLLRVAHVLPCVVLHVGHIQSTPHCLQSRTVISLVAALRELTFAPSERPLGTLGRKRMSAVAKPKPSANVIEKQLQRVLVRYDTSVPCNSGTSLSILAQTESSGERLVQMDYLSCTRWLWKASKTTPTLLLALVRRRLKEGYLLSGSRNGVVTLVAQLDVQQPSSSGKQHLLLQYVLFPFSEHPATELWVEPQYGRVCVTPPGLSYLQGTSHVDIVDKVHHVDKDLVTSVATFLHLQCCCQRQPMSNVPSSLRLTSQSYDPTCSSCDVVTCNIDNQPNSLFDSSRAVILTLVAFSEDVTGSVVDLESCSPLNSQFWKNLSIWLSEIAPTQLPTVTDSHTLLTRITTSQSVNELTSKCMFTASADTKWQSYTISHEDTVIQVCLPNMFYLAVGEEKTYVLPIVILECELAILMDPDPSQREPMSKQPDMFIHCPLISSSPPKNVGTTLTQLLSSLNTAHLSSYLDVVHTALLQGQDISRLEFITGLQVCSRAKISVDLTPLVASLCAHSSTSPPTNATPTSAPLNTETLCSLLEGVVSRLNWRCGVSPLMGDPLLESSYCSLWKEEVGGAFSYNLSSSQFVPVPRCHGYYYWLDVGVCGQHPCTTADTSKAPSDHVISPTSESSTVHRPSVSDDVITTDPAPKDEVTSDPNEIGRTDESELSSEEEMEIDPLLSPDPFDDDGEESHDSAHPHTHTHTPLFLHIDFTVRSTTTGKVHSLTESHGIREGSHDIREGSHDDAFELPLCINSLLPNISPDDSYYIAMELSFMSFTPETTPTPDVRSEVTEQPESEGVPLTDHTPLSILPHKHQATANSLKQKMEWLVADELVSICRKATPITQPLLQAVAAHIQTTHSITDKCFSQRVPLKFVFGHNNSMTHFLQELETLEVPNYEAVKTGDYYYLTPKPHPHTHAHINKMLPVNRMEDDEGRSKTPPPIAAQPQSRVHRRSLSSGYPRGHAPKMSRGPSEPGSVMASADGSVISLVNSGSGYDASQSCSVSSLSEAVGSSVRGVSGWGKNEFWMILRPFSDLVEICFQFRSSRRDVDNDLSELRTLCEHLERGVAHMCHRTNQWFLLKDMLDTRMCSPYLLSVSASEAWVDEVVSKQVNDGGVSRLDESREGFRGQQFMCGLQWSRHITPHWRLKAMKTAQAALRITRTALDAFSVSNRLDVYVVQDIRYSGEESVFYLKIDESLCSITDESLPEESLTSGEVGVVDGTRSLTRATVEAAETMSNVSMQPSISEVVPDFERKAISSSVEVLSSLHSNLYAGKPQESLVLQLYGITSPSPDLTERLNHVVQFKLDDAVLEAMCNLYARNQRLPLYPADILFLQPSLLEPSHILSIPIPLWVKQVEALVFYFLQNLSCFTLQPNYTSHDHKDHFQVPLELQNAYLAETCDVSHDIHQDHIFLYIRPHTKGRGMAVICVSLVSPEARVMTPIPGVVFPADDICPLDLENSGMEELNCPITEIQTEVKGQYSIKLHIWEKGNIGLTEFMQKIIFCFKHTLADYILELYLLPQPVATPLNGGRDSQVSPYVLVEFPTGVGEQSRRESFATQDELETVVEEGGKHTAVSHSRKISRRGSVDTTRRGSGDTSRRGSNEQTGEDKQSITSSSRRSSDDVPSSGPSRKTSTANDSRKTSTANDSKVFERTLEMETIIAPSKPEGQRTRTFTEVIMNEIEEAMQVDEEGGVSWVDNERLRREKEFEEGIKLQAHFGNNGRLEKVYEKIIPEHLSSAIALKSLSVKHKTFPVLGSYSAKVFLSQTVAILHKQSPDLAVNAFTTTTSGQFVYFEPQENWTKVERHLDSKVRDTCFILIGRNLAQFEESLNPASRSTKPWLDQQTKQPLQLLQPLDCRKVTVGTHVPLQHMPIAMDSFVPRQRLVVVKVTCQQVDMWLYNFPVESSKRIIEKLGRVSEWQSARAGLAHHLLSQKLGLFQHTQARDIQPSAKLALKHSTSIQEVAHLVKSNIPVLTEVQPSRSRLLHRPVAISDSPPIDTFYQNNSPQTPPPLTEDLVYNHGQQFRATYNNQKVAYKSQELLGKVFQSWQSHSGLSGAPVNAATISTLKRMARLIHFCSSPVLVEGCVPKVRGQSSDQVKAWCDEIKNEVLSQYILYQQSLGFEAIMERSSAQPPKHRHTPTTHQAQTPAPKLYKCLQRSWTGGIILVELCYQGNTFLVKLYTLESTRLVNQSPLTPESQTNFSVECARYKDFIHVHSFMHDFHLRLLLEIMNNTRTPPDNFDLRKYLSMCYERTTPSYVRNLVQKGIFEIATPTASVNPQILYQYLLVHCSGFGGHTLELRVGGTAEQSPLDVGLLIDVCAESLGPTTSPQLSKLINETQANYFIRIVVIPSEDTKHTLKLTYFLLLVHKSDKFPRLTRDSPDHSPACHALPPSLLDRDSDNEGTNQESELNIQVREHRRKMGFGSLSTPTLASQIVLNKLLIEEHMRGVKGHLSDVGQDALCHMRRDALWKRLLYGRVRVQHDALDRVTSSPLEGLSCSEFRELVRLVTVVPLDSLDTKLAPLKKQPRKWFKKLLRPLEVRFADNFRMYGTEDESYKSAAIINPEWQDMFILVLVDRDVKQIASVYRKPNEGGVPTKERLITANLEAERQHIETVINFVCSFLWASILDTSPPQPHLNLL